MNNECKIKDDDEIVQEELNRYNFRRFTPEEIQKKYSPFERISKKKELNFLFQKKKYSPKMEGKTSLEDIMIKMEHLDLSGNTIINEAHTPPYPPYPPFESRPPSPMPELNLKETSTMELDG